MRTALYHLDSHSARLDIRKYKFTEDRVLIRHLSHAERTIGGLWIPEVAQEQATYTKNQGFAFRGEVVSVGPGPSYGEKPIMGTPRWRKRYFDVRHPMSVKAGDIVIFERRREAEFALDGQVYSIVSEGQSIMAVIE